MTYLVSYRKTFKVETREEAEQVAKEFEVKGYQNIIIEELK